jgi:translocator protein
MEAGKGWIAPVAVAAIAALIVAGLGATITDIGPWYQALRKPDWTPPDAAFGAIWTLIFTLAAISAVYAWRAAPTSRAAGWVAGLFALNGFLNILWSLLFFRMQRPDWAFVEVAVLFASIALLIVYTGRFSRVSALLLLPYLVWVGIASVLNYQVIALNPAFG